MNINYIASRFCINIDKLYEKMLCILFIIIRGHDLLDCLKSENGEKGIELISQLSYTSFKTARWI